MIKLILLIPLFISCNQLHKSEINGKVSSKTPLVKIDSSENKKSLNVSIENNVGKTKLEPKCNEEILLTIFKNSDNLDSAMVSNLLRASDRSCKNNVEFSEFSNALLFKVLENRPDLFIESYLKLTNEIDTSYILFKLRNPINDIIPITKIINSINKLKFEKEAKNLILSNLKKGDWTK